MESQVASPPKSLADRILDILLAPEEKEKKAADTALKKAEVDIYVTET